MTRGCSTRAVSIMRSTQVSANNLTSSPPMPSLAARSDICSGDSSPSAKSGADASEAADYVLTNAKVYTVHDAQPWAEAVVVKGNKIAYVGDAGGAAEFEGEDTEVIDVGGRIIMPGFVSAQNHLIASAWTNAGVQIYDAKDKADALARIKAYAEAHSDENVIKGIGWDKNMLGGLPTAQDLDEAVSDRPAIILDNTIHDGWLNTAAFMDKLDENLKKAMG